MKKVKFTLIIFWMLFSKSYDAYCTFLHTPDLSKEANPLVTLFGFDWFLLLISYFIINFIHMLYLLSNFIFPY